MVSGCVHCNISGDTEKLVLMFQQTITTSLIVVMLYGNKYGIMVTDPVAMRGRITKEIKWKGNSLFNV